jgi:4-hydroxy-3-polyprenylbenzoate decarboxylase
MVEQSAREASRARVIVGISGASGAVYGMRLLDALGELGIARHLVVTKAGAMTLGYEMDLKPKDWQGRAEHVYAVDDIAAPIASGSFKTAGMIVAPCSVHTMSQIATGVTGNLLTRSADVCLKERRPLILLVRETPLHAGHLRTMAQLSELGAIIAPPLPAFYTKPQTIADMVDHTVGRTLDALGYEWPIARWGEGDSKGARKSGRK